MRMSCDSSHSAWLKLVNSLIRCVDGELARCRRRIGCFPKPIGRSNLSMCKVGNVLH